jgi:PAS domain S-box-containing protein
MSTDKLAESPYANASYSVSASGEMSALIRSMDWTSTSLGAPETWPDSLHSALSLCLNAQFPMAVYWGADLSLLYNDAWRPIAGDKHPWSLGRPAFEVWSEIWDAIDPLFRQVYQTGEGTFSKDQLLLMHRHGYTEECYFDFTFSPIRNLDGSIGGILNVVQETTYRVINERRSRMLREIASVTLSGTNINDVCRLAMAAIATNPADIPFAALYLVDAQAYEACLIDKVGVPQGSVAGIPERISLQENSSALYLADVMRTGKAKKINILSGGLNYYFTGPVAEIVRQAMVLPITSTGSHDVKGILVAGVSPRLAMDENYHAFYEMVTGYISTAVTKAETLEEERKRAEMLAEIDRTKTAFFSSISHEFRTPLTLMLGPIEDARFDPETVPKNQERLDLAYRNALRLQKLVNTLLDFSRIEAGRIQACYRPTELASYTAELASMFRSAVEKAGLELSITCPTLPEPVYVDKDMWEKVVLNLLSNAFKHTFEGSITVTVSLVDNDACLIVRDTGVGIPAEHLPHLFERFHRVPNTRSRTHEGSGIGLALVHELVKLHGGTIHVESLVNEGTTVIVKIPAGKAHLPADRIEVVEPAFASTAISAQSFVDEALRWLPNGVISSVQELTPELQTAGGFWQGATVQTAEKAYIILADDNADMRDYVSALLRPYCDVEVVANGAEALKAARRRMPDLILSDVNVLRADSHLRFVPVILLSARAGEEAKVEGLQAGADDYLVKPFSARELLARVKTNLDLHRVRCEAIKREKLAMEIIDGIRSELDLDNILQKTVMALGQFTHADRCRIWLYDAETGKFQMPRFEYRSDEQVKPLHEGNYTKMPVLAACLNHREMLRYTDILEAEGLTEQDRLMIEERGIKSLLHVPICYRDQLLGIVRMHTVFEKRVWDDDTVNLVLYLAAQIAVAIYHAQLIHQLQETEARKSAILESSLDAITTMDHLGRIIDWNSAAEHLFGYTREEAIGQDMASLIIPEQYREAHYKAVAQCLKSGEDLKIARAIEMPALRKDGSEFLAEVTITKTSTLGSPLFTGAIRDITERKRYEQELIESERRFRNLADTAPMYMAMADETGNAVYFNKPWLEFTGRTMGEMRGLGWLCTLHPEDAPKFERDFKNAFSQQIPINEEYRFRRADGEYRWMKAVGAPRFTPDGRFIGYFGTYTDFHDLKQAQIALQASETKFRSTFENAAIGMGITTVTGQFIEVNAAFCHMFGYSEEELRQRDVASITYADDLPRNLELLQRLLAGEIPGFVIEKRYIKKDGSTLWAQTSASMIRDSDGNPVSLIGLAEDITERKRAQEAIQESEERFRTMADSAPVAIFVTDTEPKNIYVNKGWLEYTGLSPEIALTTDWHNIVHPEDAPWYFEKFMQAFCREQLLRTEVRVRKASGEYGWLLVSASPRYTSDGESILQTAS